MSFRVVDPKKLKAVRGDRSLAQIVAKAEHKFDRASLSSWENGRWSPGKSNLPALIKALDCTFEDISSPFEENQNNPKKFAETV